MNGADAKPAPSYRYLEALLIAAPVDSRNGACNITAPMYADGNCSAAALPIMLPTPG